MRADALKQPWGPLQLGYGLVPIIAGADKFTNLLCRWEKYLSPLARRVLPVKPRTFMKLVGLVEIGAGALVLTRWPRTGGYVVSAWLGAITLNLLSTGTYFDVAARDALLSVGALTLARVSQDQPATTRPLEFTSREGASASPAPTGVAEERPTLIQ